MQEHKKGYKTYCELPSPSFRWKVGQVWMCECGNMFVIRKIYRYDGQGGSTCKEWVFVEDRSK